MHVRFHEAGRNYTKQLNQNCYVLFCTNIGIKSLPLFQDYKEMQRYVFLGPKGCNLYSLGCSPR